MSYSCKKKSDFFNFFIWSLLRPLNKPQTQIQLFFSNSGKAYLDIEIRAIERSDRQDHGGQFLELLSQLKIEVSSCEGIIWTNHCFSNFKLGPTTWLMKFIDNLRDEEMRRSTEKRHCGNYSEQCKGQQAQPVQHYGSKLPVSLHQGLLTTWLDCIRDHPLYPQIMTIVSILVSDLSSFSIKASSLAAVRLGAGGSLTNCTSCSSGSFQHLQSHKQSKNMLRCYDLQNCLSCWHL